MALALDIMKGGVSAVTAKAIQGQVAPTVTAAGSTVSDAFTLVASINVITVATAGQGVKLTSAEVADEVDICNISGANVVVYPDTGSRVNGLPTNQGFVLANNTSVKLKKFTATRWLGNLSA